MPRTLIILALLSFAAATALAIWPFAPSEPFAYGGLALVTAAKLVK